MLTTGRSPGKLGLVSEYERRGGGAVLCAVAVLVLAALGGGCKSKYDSAKGAAGYGPTAGAPPSEPVPESAPAEAESSGSYDGTVSGRQGEGVDAPAGTVADPHAAPATRMIVYRAFLRLAVAVVTDGLAAIDALALRHGGYVESSTLSRRVLRIPVQRYRDALAELRRLGDVLDFQQSTEDVTEQYQDVAARIDNLRALRARYLELLAQATTMEQRLAVEKELRRIELELRVLEEERRLLADRAAFATVTVDLEPRHEERAVRDRAAQPFAWVRDYRLDGLFGG